jgi:signal transduction histidine kinase
MRILPPFPIETFVAVVAVSTCTLLAAMSPYEVDEQTLHLWHLDEDGPPFADSGVSPKPLLGLLYGAEAGKESLAGMGRAVSFDHSAGGKPQTSYFRGALLMAQPVSVNGSKDNVTAPFPIMGDDGAFTIEALIKFQSLPSEAKGVALDIVSMDDEGTGRVFNFRIIKPGFLSFTPYTGLSVRGGGLATIPVTGAHAINTKDWFHVAVAYNGREGSAGNLKLYWTRIGPGLDAANLIGTGFLPADLSKGLGDFAIGNTARTVLGKKTCNPFPGLIDEVRISGIARPAHDYLLVTPEAKARAASVNPKKAARPEFRLELQKVALDGQSVVLPRASAPLVVEPGQHRLDIDFSLAPEVNTERVSVRCRLEGIDDPWQPAVRGMLLVCDVLDEKRDVVSRASFSSIGQSKGWSGDPYESKLIPRLEPLYLPGNAKFIRIMLSSGTPDTTGQIVIDNLAVHLPSAPAGTGALWPAESFGKGEMMDLTGGTPSGWQRAGDDPSIAWLIFLPRGRAIGLVDGKQSATGVWTSTRPLPRVPAGGCSVSLSWDEAYNIIGGNLYRATYLTVPPGNYHFRAIAVARKPGSASSYLELPIKVRSPLWENPWFRPAAAAAAVGLIALAILQTFRRRTLARISKLNLRNTLERDRARIARDMHDDLGTRVSSMILGTSLVQRDLDRDPVATRRHLVRMGSAARDLATAMDELIWAVNPVNDTLDKLASHLGGLVQDMFGDERFRLQIRVPTDLPQIPLRAEFRHHFSLAVKEALHNVLKHAGPCDVSLEVKQEGGQFIAVVQDTGCGFDPSTPEEGNGLLNLHSRLAELGGSCEVESAPGSGTTVVLRCLLEQQIRPSLS